MNGVGLVEEMPPKKKSEPGKKTVEKKKEKVIEVGEYDNERIPSVFLIKNINNNLKLFIFY